VHTVVLALADRGRAGKDRDPFVHVGVLRLRPLRIRVAV